MKSWKYILALIAIPIISQATIITNTSYNVIGSSAGNKYDDFWWDVGSYSDVVLDWKFNQSLAGGTPSFRMSQMTSTGRVIYVNFTTNNSDIAISTTNVTVTLPRTNMPYRGVYEAEVQNVDGSGYWTPVSRGKVNVTLSLFDPSLSNFSLPSVTNIDLHTVLGNGNSSTRNINLTGSGTYQLDGVDIVTDGGITNVVGSTNIVVEISGTTATVSTDGSLQTAIDANSSTGALNTASIATLQATTNTLAETLAAGSNGGTNDVTGIKSLQFTGGTGDQGKMEWNAADETVDLICDGSTIQIGQEFVKHVRNETGATITNGTPVAAYGIDSGTDNVLVRPMIADGTDPIERYYGVATADIPHNDNGKCTLFGKVRNMDTLAFSVGDTVYISATVAGGLTTTPPASPNLEVYVGLVLVDSATLGVIDVATQPEDRNQFLPVAGGTMTGDLVSHAGASFSNAVTTSRDFTAMAPAADEFPSADWVRSLALTGQEWFFTDTVATQDWAKTANFVDLSLTVPASVFTNSIASPVASDTYLAGGIATNMFGSLRSPISFEIYMNRVGGNASTQIPVHPEIYYVYDGTTNQLGDWDAADQIITATTPTKYTYTVAFAEPSLTGSVQLVGYLKSGTVSGSAAGLNIYGGGIYPSHMDIGGVPAGETFDDALHINGDNAMTGDINVGGNDITNAGDVVSTTFNTYLKMVNGNTESIGLSHSLPASGTAPDIILGTNYLAISDGASLDPLNDGQSDLGQDDYSYGVVHTHTNFFKGHGGSSNITMKSNIFGVTNAISFTIGGDTYSILFD